MTELVHSPNSEHRQRNNINYSNMRTPFEGKGVCCFPHFQCGQIGKPFS